MTISISPIFIMHYCVFVLIPQDADIDIEIEKALAPFDDDLKVDPYKVYLDPREITAMARHYGTKRSALKQLATHMEDWRSGLGGVDDRGLFAVSTFNPNTKWDWYAIGGRWDGHLPGNVLSATALLESPRSQVAAARRAGHARRLLAPARDVRLGGLDAWPLRAHVRP